MSDITKAQALARVRLAINEPVAQRHSDADINEWLDEGVRLASNIGLCKETSETFTLATSTDEYLLETTITVPDGLVYVTDVFYHGAATATVDSSISYSLMYVQPRNFKHLTQQADGAPVYYTISGSPTGSGGGGYLYVYPAPTVTQNGFYCTIFYFYELDEYDTNGTTVPEWIDDAVIWYAIAKAFEREEKYAQAQQYRSYFNSFILFHRQDRLPKRIDSADMMKLPDYTQYVQ